MTASESTTVLYDVTAGVATLTLNRPEKLNAWIPEMAARYFELMDRAAADLHVRVIVITGAGRAFCAGADIGYLREVLAAAQGAPQDRFRTMDIPKPVIAAVNGPCVGLALPLIASCDIRFAVTGAKFSTSFARLGLPAEVALAWTLPRLVGQGPALELLLSGRPFLAAEAMQIGLVTRVYPEGQFKSQVTRYAREMAEQCSPTALAHIKRQVWRAPEAGFAEAERESLSLVAEAVQGEDFKEGLASFTEKRPPRYGPLRPRF